MEENIKGIILLVLIAFLTTTSSFLLSLTGISVSNFLTINFFPLLEKTMSINFILFLILASITMLTLIIITKTFEMKKTLIVSLVGYALGAILSLVFFLDLNFLPVLLFGGIGIIIATKFFKPKEVTESNLFKEGNSFAGKIVIFFSIGTFIAILLITIPNSQEYENNFTKDILSSFISGDSIGISNQLLDSIGQLQKETLNGIQQTEEYKKMQTKNDSDFFALELKIEDTKVLYTSKEYQDLISEQIKKMGSADSDNAQQINNTLSTNIPQITILAKFAWIIYALTGLIFVIFIGELIIKNLSSLMYAIITKFTNKQDLTKA